MFILLHLTERKIMRDRLFNIIEGNSDLLISKIISWVILLAILISSVAFVLESDPDLLAKHEKTFHLIDTIVVIIFTIEYVSRLVLVRKRLQFFVQPLNIIDLLAILPFYITLFWPTHLDLRIVRLIRLIRIFRLFKLAKYSESFALTARALKDSSAALFALIILMMLVLVMNSSFMYFAEHEAHISRCSKALCSGQWIEGQHSPEELYCPVCRTPLELPTGNANVAKNFRSISKTFWWCMVTMTTVGYGDVVPQTTLGAFIASITMILGILCIALPTGVVATNFASLYQESVEKKKQRTAPTPEENQKKLQQSMDALLKAAEEVVRHHPKSNVKNATERKMNCPHCTQEIILEA